MSKAASERVRSPVGKKALGRLYRRGVVAGLLGLWPAAAGAAPGGEAPGSELAALRAEITDLRRTVAEDDAAVRRLQALNAGLEGDISAYRGAVALSTGRGDIRGEVAESPSSTLDWPSALRAAAAARLMVQGSALLTVMPTGSMEPMFNERAILLVEPARFESLRVGDVVTYRHPGYGLVVVHRILEKRGDKFWSKGDNNGRMDSVYITRENYRARVFGIIYAREKPGGASRSLGGSLAAR